MNIHISDWRVTVPLFLEIIVNCKSFCLFITLFTRSNYQENGKNFAGHTKNQPTHYCFIISRQLILSLERTALVIHPLETSHPSSAFSFPFFLNHQVNSSRRVVVVAVTIAGQPFPPTFLNGRDPWQHGTTFYGKGRSLTVCPPWPRNEPADPSALVSPIPA